MMNTDKKWTKIVSNVGWKREEDIEFPLFTKIVESEQAVYIECMPDTAMGLIPVKINVPLKRQEEIHNYYYKFSNRLFFGDITNNWYHPDYRKEKIQYQIIDLKDFKIEKEARSQVRQAEKFGVSIRKMNGLKEYWECVKNTGIRQEHRKVMHPWALENMIKVGEGLEAVHDGKVIAGCVFVEEDGIIRYAHSASLTDSMHLRPNHLILNTLIDIGKERGVEEIHLGNAPATLEGLIKFKESFGAQMRTFDLCSYAK